VGSQTKQNLCTPQPLTKLDVSEKERCVKLTTVVWVLLVSLVISHEMKQPEAVWGARVSSFLQISSFIILRDPHCTPSKAPFL
jgi:hypothetical protein